MRWTARSHEPTSASSLPERKLWQSVVWRALKDCVSEDPRVRREAQAWASGGTKDFHQVCDLADFTSDHVERAARVLYDLGCVRGKKWLGKTKEKTR